MAGATVEPAGASFPGRNGKIVFASNRVTPDNPTGDLEIFVVKPDGIGIQQLTNNTAHDYQPAWSPDGKKIAFMSTRDGNLEIYTMAANGANPTNRTTNPADDLSPGWQPKRR